MHQSLKLQSFLAFPEFSRVRCQPMKRAAVACILFFSLQLFALEGLYIGARGGYVGLISDLKQTHGNAIGYGLDIGLATNPFLDVLFQFHQSQHDAGLKISAFFVAADLNLVRVGGYDFFLTIGPAMYFFDVNGSKATKFGMHGGFGTDYWFGRKVRLGVVARWHGVFSQTAADNFWTVMGRLGYRFKL